MHKILRYQINDQQNGLTLKAVLSSLGYSRHEISRFKFAGYRMTLDLADVHTDRIVHTGQILEIEELKQENHTLGPCMFIPDIVYEDEDLVLVNKPSGIPSHPGHLHLSDDMGTALRNYYGDKGFVIRPIGRLDKDVSGLMLYAKNQLAAARLIKQRQEGILCKHYIAYIHGTISESGKLCYRLANEIGNKRRLYSDDGKICITEYHVLEKREGYTVVKIHLQTGRTHQIRAGFAHYGHPLLGDALYGGSCEHIKRPALHCNEIKFLQPFSLQPHTFRISLPGDMKKQG